MTVVAAPVGVELDVTATLAGVVVDAIEAVVDTGAAGPPPPPQAGSVPIMLWIAVNSRARLKLNLNL